MNLESNPGRGLIFGISDHLKDAEIDSLAQCDGAPIELVMSNPEKEFPLLYRHAKLLDKHPMRVCIPVTHGFDKALKVAAALQFAVKLEPGQPTPELVPDLLDALDFYLHHQSVTQPIDFFHGALYSLYHHLPTTLWEIQEEAPPPDAPNDECGHCEFFRSCSGYFKFPRPEYDCDGVKSILRKLSEAAAELRMEAAA